MLDAILVAGWNAVLRGRFCLLSSTPLTHLDEFKGVSEGIEQVALLEGEM